ncbi:MAG: efflux RND transporter permease subunit [Bdellovibrionales bacterium]|nr:efflux RND transporter permease subunit [Bdellovibrionales bacterium]
MSLASLSIKRPVFISSIVLLLLISGLFSLKKLGVDLFPNISLPVVSIQTVYAGASPNDIETLISKPIEDELGNLEGLKRITSNNLESLSVVVAEFKLGVDLKDVEQQIRNRLGNIRKKLPTEIEEPIVRRLDPADQPIMRIGVRSKLPPADIYDIVCNKVKVVFERAEGVGLVEIVGGRKREVQVIVDREKLQQREIPVMQIAQRLETSSKNVPVGKVNSGTKETIFRTLGEFLDINSMRDVAINFLGSDRPVHLGDVAKVVDGLEEEKTRSTINGESAIFLEVYKKSGGNTVQVAQDVRKALAKLGPELKQRGIDIELDLVRDGSKKIKDNVDDVYESIIIGVLLCVVVVFFFLGSFRSTLITGLALPNSLLGAFILMYAMGFTVNIMTLLALSLAVGLLIDDAIVVRENIFRHMEMGKPAKQAAEEGTMEVSTAVIATTLVVMAVFGPIAFLDGVVGQFFREFGLTMVFAVGISLFDAMTVAPMLSAYWAGSAKHGEGGSGVVAKALKAFDNFQTWLENVYEQGIRFTLRRPKTIIAIGVALFFGSLLLTPGIPKTFVPSPDSGEFEVKLEMPPGTNLEAMADRVTAMDNYIRQQPSVRLTSAAAGNKEGEPNKGSIYVSLKSKKERGMKTSQVKDMFREDLNKKFADNGMLIKIQDYDEFGGGQRPFNLNIMGDDLDQLAEYSGKVLERMKKIPGIADPDMNYRAGKPEFQVVFDRRKAEALGVAVGTAGGELRARVEGIVPATYRKNGEEYDIRVKMDEAYRDVRKEFPYIVVPNVNFNLIPLKQIAMGREVSGFSQINRQNKSRYVLVSSDIASNGALSTLTNETVNILTKEMPPPPGITWGFVGQAEDFQDLIKNMIVAISLGVTFIYLVLASLYESFVIPFTILLALPLAVCGALAALFITHASINVFSMIGLVMLLGVVTKNSILLVDYTLKLIEEGNLSRDEAIVKACKTRLRPILMTSIAIIAGTIPIAIGLNEASSQRTAMGIALIGGLISSTFLTLLIVPAAYRYVDDFRLWSLRLVNGKKKHA